MIEITCLDLKTNKVFAKLFDNIKKANAFKRKCKYSKKIKIISSVDYSNLYD